MTEENQRNLGTEGGAEATLVTPIFDEKAAETAQPVVPLAASALAGSSFVTRTAQRIPGAAVGHPSWMLGLILASVLVGSVLGGLGLRFYQKRQSANAANAPAAATEQPAPDAIPADTDASAPKIIETTEATTTEPNGDSSNILISERKEIPAEADAPKDAATDVRDEGGDATRQPAKEAKSAPVVERKRADDDAEKERDREAKKKTRDDDAAREAARPRRTRNDAPRTQTETDGAEYDASVPRARMVDSITVEARRIRRQERRRGAQPPERQPRTVDRVRGIFEGQPPR